MSGHTQSARQTLAKALSQWRGPQWRPGLEQIYSALPATTCARQGACCGLLPPVQPVEMLAWLDDLCQADEQTAGRQAVTLVEHFLQNAARRLPCPWALSDSCARYDKRFFGCRAYGLWPPQAYEPRRQQSLAAARAVQAAWQGMGVSLPPEVCAPPPDYCGKVRPLDGVGIDGEVLDALEGRLAGIGRDEPWHELLSQYGGDLSYLVAGLALGWHECLQAKVTVTRALLADDENRAQETMAQAGQAARAWARDLISSPA